MEFQKSALKEINLILLLNLFLNLFEIVITERFLILSFKKFDIINKFFSTPPPSIDGINIISFFCICRISYNLNNNVVIIKKFLKNFNE